MSIGGLGRGFEALIPTDLVDDEFDLTVAEDKAESELKQIKIDEIVRDEDQPRREFEMEALEELAESIREHGVLQPIVVTREDGQYKIVAGERRWRAAKLAGLTKIPAIVRSLDSQHRLEISIIENAQREDLNPIELATAYAKLKAQFNMTAEEIAAKVGKSEITIAATMRLLNFPEDVKKIMVQEKLPEGVMKPLLAIDDEEKLRAILKRIVDEGWSARKVERYMMDTRKQSSAKAIKAVQYHKEEDRLVDKYGAREVKITARSVTFKCKSEAEVKELLKRLQ